MAADIPDLAAVEVNFDGITYAKGASVLKQLVAYVGLEHFLSGLRDYFRAHAFGNATFSDLLGALEKASGRDLSDWGRHWLKTTGLNTLRADFDVDADGQFTRFAVTQSGAAPGAGETRVHRLAVGVYDDDGDGRLARVHREELDVSGESTEVPALVGVPHGKLILVNDDDLTYCSLRLDPESLQTALDRIADIAEPLPRTLVWSAAWEMTRDAELRARDFVSLVSGGIHAETEVGVAQRLLLQAQTALGSYADPDWAEAEGWPAFADRLLELARAAARRFGSSAGLRQRALHVGAVTAACDGAGRPARPRPRRVGTGRSGGRHRPALAHRHRAGRRGRDRRRWDGDAVHRRRGAARPDRCGQTSRRAGRGRAAAGGSEGSGVDQVTEDDTLANITARSIIGGFAQPGQAELLEPFGAKYFAAIAGVWERRSSEVAQTVVVGLYPSWDISDEGIAAADAFLADPGLPAALRRLVLEGRAGVERSLRARRFDSDGEALTGPPGRHAGEIPALVTRIALTRPSIRSPSLNDAAAAATPSGAADSAPRPRTCEP